MQKLLVSEVSNIYGRRISFSVQKKDGLPFKDGSVSKDLDMYAPNLVEITNPKIETAEDQYPHCYSKDFVLEWNADSQNEEGLIMVVEYQGLSAVPDKNEPVHLINTNFIANDTGRTQF